MNWIEFSKERPKEEPRRELLVRLTSGRHSVWWSTDRSDAWPHVVTDWCEIEPTVEDAGEAVREMREFLAMPEPDPFEGAKAAAWRKYRPPTWNLADHEYFKAGWDAAMKHKEDDDKSPYWLCRSLAEFVVKHHPDCERSGDVECHQSTDFVTEWCAPCAAKAFVCKVELAEKIKPPKPNPLTHYNAFEEWWKDTEYPEDDKDNFQAGWYAALKYKEEK